MTEQSYKQAREVLAKAKSLKDKIVLAKGDVSKWSLIESSHRQEGRISNADGTKKILEKAVQRLDKAKADFDALLLPDSNIHVVNTNKQCEGCGNIVKNEEDFCDECKGTAKQKIIYCQACSFQKHGVKTRRSIPHTCGK